MLVTVVQNSQKWEYQKNLRKFYNFEKNIFPLYLRRVPFVRILCKALQNLAFLQCPPFLISVPGSIAGSIFSEETSNNEDSPKTSVRVTAAAKEVIPKPCSAPSVN